jgi:hypothetical protein
LANLVVLVALWFAGAGNAGMERRNDRRANRAGARAAKQACKAGDEKSRAECRQEKREVKQTGRNDDSSKADGAAAPKPAQ